VGTIGVQPADQIEATFEQLVPRHKAASGQPPRSRYPRIDDFRLEWVNVDADLASLVKTLRQRAKGRLLFHGPSGTGKTALAHHLAEALDRPLLAKRTADVVSKYIGETEKNLRDMFEEAQADEAVLFLDEADSFLQDRRTAQRHWEVTEVNELLTRMEMHDGVFIAATNLLDHLDPAAMRRFGLKLEFKPLRPAQAAELFATRYQAIAGRELKPEERAAASAALDRLDLLTPGDFAAASVRWEMLGKIPSPEEFVESLREEHHVKPGATAKRMGFG
jgi:SpoVK/Ycf46/Vps4 family AAA+-type ATPase